MNNTMFIFDVLKSPRNFIYSIDKDNAGNIIRITAQKRGSNRGIIFSDPDHLDLFLTCSTHIDIYLIVSCMGFEVQNNNDNIHVLLSDYSDFREFVSDNDLDFSGIYGVKTHLLNAFHISNSINY